MIAIIALDGDVLEYDAKEKKVYVKVKFYGRYSGLMSVFATDGSTVAEAKKNEARTGRHFVINQRGTVSKDTI